MQHSLTSKIVGLSLLAATLLATAHAQDVLVNSLGMRLVRIPAGAFDMGSDEPKARLHEAYPHVPESRFKDFEDEAPVHRVQITRPFYLGQHEVTVGQFERFLAASGHQPESVADGTGGYGYSRTYDQTRAEKADAFEGRKRDYSWRNPGFAQDGDHPVVNVSWNDAVAMARWLSQTEGVRYRLPTEAEWEYACRAGTRSRYPNGDDPQGLARIANTFDADATPFWTRWQDMALKAHDGFAFTAPVGRFEPNAFGLHDMLGNVWEWVSDWYGEDYYAHAPQQDPQGPADGQVRVRRGGSWHSWTLYTRCSFRNWNTVETRYTLVGFRLVRE